MKILAKSLSLSVASAMALASFSALADYPDGPITVVAPYGPGGSSDLAARTMASSIPDYIGGNVLVVNRTGAAGVVGSNFVRNAAPDGETLLLARYGSHATGPALNPDAPYDWDDFTYLGMLSLDAFVCIVPKDSPYDNLDEWREGVAASPGQYSYSTSGFGTGNHLVVSLLLDSQGIDPESANHVPYEGDGEVVSSVVGGHVDFTCVNLSPALGQIQSGTVKPLGVTTAERVDDLPDVPSFSELGYDSMEAGVGWSALVGPPDMNGDIVEAWAGALEQLKDSESWNASVVRLGAIPSIMSPEDTLEFVGSQVAVIRDIVERLDLAN
jgi:tripartite-type tricarboxylate transporter receptor subunit TctC